MLAVDALVDQGMGKKACDLLVLGCDLFPKAENLLEKTIQSLRQFGREGEARRLLMGRLKVNADDWMATRLLARIDFHNDKREKYQKRIDDFLKKSPEHLPALIEKAKFDQVSGGLETEKHLEEILRLDPHNLFALAHLQQYYAQEGEFEKARHALETLKRLYPNEPVTFFGEGLLYDQMQDFEKALIAYDKAIQANPQFVEAYGKSGGMLCKLGRDLPEAWYRLEARFPQLLDRPDGPFWRGEDLTGKKLLIWAEQGIGDQLSFASMLRDLPVSLEQVDLECDEKLVPLFSRTFPTFNVYGRRKKRKEIYDYHSPIGALARYLRPSLESFTQTKPCFLSVDYEQVQKWQDWLSGLGEGAKIGLCWKSGAVSRKRIHEGLDLSGAFSDVLKQEGRVFVNLYYKDAAEELQQLGDQHGIVIHEPPSLDQFHDIDQTAALVKTLDFVVGVASAPTRLAQAVGTKTVIMYRGDPGKVDPLWWPNTEYICRNLDDEEFDLNKLNQILDNQL